MQHQDAELLYPKILWNRPISRATAGRLLLVGGSKGHAANLQGAHQLAAATGIGAVSLLVPDVLRPLLGTLPDMHFGPSTLSGSLANGCLAELEELSNHSDAVIIGLDASNNSETAILFEKFVSAYDRSLIVVDDALSVIPQTPDVFRGRPSTLLIISMQQLFKLAGGLQLPLAIKSDAGIAGKVDIVRSLWEVIKVDLAVVGPEIIIQVGEQTSATQLPAQPPQLLTAAYGVLAVMYTQNPSARYEGLTTGAFLLKSAATTATASINDLGQGIERAIRAHEG